MELTERQIEKKTVFTGIIVNVRQDVAELENGKRVMREVVEHPGGVAVLPVNEAGEALLVRQFRYPFMERMLEIPAGKLEPGEDPRDAGLRELKEETGCSCARFISLGAIYPSPGVYREKLYIYLALGLTQGEQSPDEDEFLRVETMPLDELRRRCAAGELPDAKTNVAVFRACDIIDKGSV